MYDYLIHTSNKNASEDVMYYNEILVRMVVEELESPPKKVHYNCRKDVTIYCRRDVQHLKRVWILSNSSLVCAKQCIPNDEDVQKKCSL